MTPGIDPSPGGVLQIGLPLWIPQWYPKVPILVNVLLTGCPGVRAELKEAASSSSQPLSALLATRSKLCGGPGARVQVTVPPTLIVVTGVPLTSSVNLKLATFTAAVRGAVAAGVGVDAAASRVGVPVAVATVVLSFAFWLCCVQEIEPSSKTVIAVKPKTLSIGFLLRSRLGP